MPNRLSKIRVREISLVDAPASEGSDIVLTKNRRRQISGAYLAKAWNAGDWGTVDRLGNMSEADVAKEALADLERDAQRRNGSSKVRKMVNDILRKGAPFHGDDEPGTAYSESDRVGVQDGADEDAGDLEAVARTAMSCPPTASETFPQWASRVYGAQVKNMEPAELRLARKLFDAMRAGTILKRRADAAVDEIVRKRMAADPSKSWHQHWAIVMKEEPGLYSALHKSALGPSTSPTPNRDFGTIGSEGLEHSMVQNGWGGGDQNGGTALDALNEAAEDIRKRSLGTAKPLSKAQSFVQACKANPDLYEAHKAGR